MAYITLSDGWNYGEMTEREIARLNDKMERAVDLAGIEYRYVDEGQKFIDADDVADEIEWWNECPCWYRGTAAAIAKWLKTRS